ncbi:protein MAM3, putative [Plasmodium sp. DRC-Itaito]|nr:protein MAM3, putative [Plasmodium sp. DRC-Itaito]
MQLWLLITCIVVCGILSSLFSGLSLGIMMLDTLQLNLLILVSEKNKKEINNAKNARKILPLRNNTNEILVTFITANVMVNSAFSLLLSEVTDGFTSFIISTLIITIFGEIIPQSICSKHGLAIGGFFAPLIYVLKFLLYLFAKPTSLLLDHFVGKNVLNTYDKKQLKALVDMHKSAANILHEDEAKILVSALELSQYKIVHIMTDIDYVFGIDYNTIINYDTIKKILKSGFSRIPVINRNKAECIVGLIHIKDLINIWFGINKIIFDNRNKLIRNQNIKKNGKIHLVYKTTNGIDKNQTDNSLNDVQGGYHYMKKNSQKIRIANKIYTFNGKKLCSHKILKDRESDIFSSNKKQNHISLSKESLNIKKKFISNYQGIYSNDIYSINNNNNNNINSNKENHNNYSDNIQSDSRNCNNIINVANSDSTSYDDGSNNDDVKINIRRTSFTNNSSSNSSCSNIIENNKHNKIINSSFVQDTNGNKKKNICHVINNSLENHPYNILISNQKDKTQKKKPKKIDASFIFKHNYYDIKSSDIINPSKLRNKKKQDMKKAPRIITKNKKVNFVDYLSDNMIDTNDENSTISSCNEYIYTNIKSKIHFYDKNRNKIKTKQLAKIFNKKKKQITFTLWDGDKKKKIEKNIKENNHMSSNNNNNNNNDSNNNNNNNNNDNNNDDDHHNDMQNKEEMISLIDDKYTNLHLKHNNSYYNNKDMNKNVDRKKTIKFTTFNKLYHNKNENLREYINTNNKHNYAVNNNKETSNDIYSSDNMKSDKTISIKNIKTYDKEDPTIQKTKKKWKLSQSIMIKENLNKEKNIKEIYKDIKNYISINENKSIQIPLKYILKHIGRYIYGVDYNDSILSLLNFFKSASNHMVVVRKVIYNDNEDPRYAHIGIITLEDVIEILLQEEISDEFDFKKIKTGSSIPSNFVWKNSDESKKKIRRRNHKVLFDKDNVKMIEGLNVDASQNKISLTTRINNNNNNNDDDGGGGGDNNKIEHATDVTKVGISPSHKDVLQRAQTILKYKKDIMNFLKESIYFKYIDPQLLNQYIQRKKIKTLYKDELLLKDNTFLNYAIILIKGKVKNLSSYQSNNIIQDKCFIGLEALGPSNIIELFNQTIEKRNSLIKNIEEEEEKKKKRRRFTISRARLTLKSFRKKETILKKKKTLATKNIPNQVTKSNTHVIKKNINILFRKWYTQHVYYNKNAYVAETTCEYMMIPKSDYMDMIIECYCNNQVEEIIEAS